MHTATPTRRLYRSTRDSKIAGVCGGIAEHMGWDVSTVRLVVALSILLPGPQVIAYLIAWVVLPTDRTTFGWDAPASQMPPMPPAPTMPPAPSTPTQPEA